MRAAVESTLEHLVEEAAKGIQGEQRVFVPPCTPVEPMDVEASGQVGVVDTRMGDQAEVVQIGSW